VSLPLRLLSSSRGDPRAARRTLYSNDDEIVRAVVELTSPDMRFKVRSTARASRTVVVFVAIGHNMARRTGYWKAHAYELARPLFLFVCSTTIQALRGKTGIQTAVTRP